jgi:hypothetical protein
VIITVRDRLTPLQQLIAWLEVVGQHEIWLCDNASTYGPLVEYLAVTPYKVVRNTRNLGHRAPWLSGLAAEIGHDKPFIVTDPDVVPTAGCPYDVLELFEHTLHSHTEFDKVGFSLKIDDLPDHYANKADVIAWETQFWTVSTSRTARRFVQRRPTKLAICRGIRTHRRSPKKIGITRLT